MKVKLKNSVKYAKDLEIGEEFYIYNTENTLFKKVEFVFQEDNLQKNEITVMNVETNKIFSIAKHVEVIKIKENKQLLYLINITIDDYFKTEHNDNIYKKVILENFHYRLLSSHFGSSIIPVMKINENKIYIFSDNKKVIPLRDEEIEFEK